MLKYGMIPVLLMFGIQAAFAQVVKEGKVTYERKINMHKRMPPEAEQFKAMVPEFQISKMELMFNGTQSSFKNLPDPEDEMPTGTDAGGTRRMNFRFGGGVNDETFRDYDKEQIIESRELGPKTYIIEDTLRRLKWKLEEDTMTIGGYLCQKATTTTAMFGMGGGGMRFGMGGQGGGVSADSAARRMNIPREQKVEAWFAPDIETSAGPDNYFGLPGLIMKVIVDEGTVALTALNVEPLDKATVKVPTNGKKITREEYRKLMQQQFQGMGRPGGGPGGQGGQRIIIAQ
jgi:GLPGLI family protein